MLQTLGLKIGSAAQHPVGVSLMHRPVPEHARHLSGQKQPTVGRRPAARKRSLNPFKR